MAKVVRAAVAGAIVASLLFMMGSCDIGARDGNKVATTVTQPGAPGPEGPGEETKKMKVTSTAFAEGESIPVKYTCDGANVSPELAWEGVTGARSYALIADDPDAPSGDFVHWVVYDIPGGLTELAEGQPAGDTLPNGAKQGNTDFRRPGWGGPCPPAGTHRYFFKVFALDKELGLTPGATKDQVQQAMQGHVLAQGELTGRYGR